METETTELPSVLESSRLLSVMQVAALIGVSRMQVFRWMRRKNPIPSLLIPSRVRRFRYSDVMKWIEGQSWEDDSRKPLP